MNIFLQCVLIGASVLTIVYMLRKIRKSHLKIDDSIFWILFSMGLFIISIFPQIPTFFARLLSIQSASNFIFLAMIFVLLLKQFLVTVEISRLENKLQTLVQRIAIMEISKEQKEKQENLV